MTSQQKKSSKQKPATTYQIFQNQGIANKVNSSQFGASGNNLNLNSTSCNKSKGSRKNSKSTKKYKMSLKQSKDNSHSVSVQRKFSLNRANKTEPHFNQAEEVFGKLFLLKQKLSKIKYPQDQSIQSIQLYYQNIKKSLQTPQVQKSSMSTSHTPPPQPLNQIFLFVHQLYVAPLTYVLNLIKPLQVQLKRQQDVIQEIHKFYVLNKKIYESMCPQDQQIFQVKERIQINSQQIRRLQAQKLIQQQKKHKKKRPQTSAANRKQDFRKNKKHNFQLDSKDQSQAINNFSDIIKTKQDFLIRNGNSQQSNHIQNKNVEIIEGEEGEDQNNFNGSMNSSSLEDQQFVTNQVDTIAQSQKPHNKSMGLSFKLDLGHMGKNPNVGFHDQFYSKLDQFSESWRNQALKQKRF